MDQSLNILMSADRLYYNEWAENCIKSIQNKNPHVSITVIVISKEKVNELAGVRYHYDDIDISSLKDPIAYYQAVRFLKCIDLFPNNELVMSIDCDTICTNSFSIESFKEITKSVHVLKHHKKDRWMAGLVTYGDTNDFRKRFKEELLKIPVTDWKWGYDQQVLNYLSKEFSYSLLNVGNWMSFGKGRGVFITLKGGQKTKPKFLGSYNNLLKSINGNS